MKADINDPTECLKIKYRFCFEDGEVECHDVNLDPHTLELLDAPESDPSDWTCLEFNQCPNCPLSTSEHEHCPAALASNKKRKAPLEQVENTGNGNIQALH